MVVVVQISSLHILYAFQYIGGRLRFAPDALTLEGKPS